MISNDILKKTEELKTIMVSTSKEYLQEIEKYNALLGQIKYPDKDDIKRLREPFIALQERWAELLPAIEFIIDKYEVLNQSVEFHKEWMDREASRFVTKVVPVERGEEIKYP